MNRTYQICTRCVMDTTDPDIQFDELGVCNHCRAMLERMRSVVNTDPQHLQQIVERIRNEGQGKRYDCILGVSGGVDSTYLAYLTKKLELRPLAVHLDNGWDSELAVKNIENILNKLDIDLYTKVLDWESFRDLQVAFLKASTPDSEIPTDHAIHATLYNIARRERVRFILQGMNLRTEGIMPRGWTYGAYDWHYIHSIHKRFRTRPLQDFPHFSLADRLLNFGFYRLRVVFLLNMVDYKKQETMSIIKNELGWQDYGVKHGESIYTRYYQSYILPNKFGIDKRKAHLSCLVISGQLKREVALEMLKSDPYPSNVMESDQEYVIKKLGLTGELFQKIMENPPKTFRDYPNQNALIQNLGLLIRFGRQMKLLSPQSGL